MSEKKALKGFADLRFFPIDKNDAENYKVGTKVTLSGAQSCTATDTRNDYSIPADDMVYDEGSDYQSTELQITMVEMQLEHLAKLAGAKYDSSKKVLTESSLDVAPDVALGFSGLLISGGKRLFLYTCAKLTNYKVDMNTKGNDNGVRPVTLTFKCRGRACDGAVRQLMDAAAVPGGAPDISWLDNVAVVPAAPGG